MCEPIFMDLFGTFWWKCKKVTTPECWSFVVVQEGLQKKLGVKKKFGGVKKNLGMARKLGRGGGGKKFVGHQSLLHNSYTYWYLVIILWLSQLQQQQSEEELDELEIPTNKPPSTLIGMYVTILNDDNTEN